MLKRNETYKYINHSHVDHKIGEKMKKIFFDYDYRKAKQTDSYVVDKTLLIQELFEENARVSLVTRPR